MARHKNPTRADYMAFVEREVQSEGLHHWDPEAAYEIGATSQIKLVDKAPNWVPHHMGRGKGAIIPAYLWVSRVTALDFLDPPSQEEIMRRMRRAWGRR